MSQNLTGRNIKFNLKVGDLATLSVTMENIDSSIKDLSDVTVYNTAIFKVWKPDGTLIINGAASYALPRTDGIIQYTLQSSDTVFANAGNWEGEVECYNEGGSISDQSATFNFSLAESY